MLYQCPHCKSTLETEEAISGSRVDCTKCGKEFVAVPLSIPTPPEYVGFMEAWKRKWTRWHRTGRASRSEYWWGVLAHSLEWLVVSILDTILTGSCYNVLFWLWFCISIVPATCQYLRRFHDAGHSGRWVVVEHTLFILVVISLEFSIYGIASLILLLFAIVQIITLVFTLQPSKNRSLVS
jgi:uncharacterized membrane protein YhaH (DUF805 family)